MLAVQRRWSAVPLRPLPAVHCPPSPLPAHMARCVRLAVHIGGEVDSGAASSGSAGKLLFVVQVECDAR